MTDSLVKEFYTGNVRSEWRRLVKDAYHRLEFDTSLHFLAKYLPPSGLVLDAGGGPGRYTIELAKKGYQVILFDATPANLDFARRQIKKAGLQGQVKEITAGSIVDLSKFADNTFNAVLCTGGPLSHILDPHQRDQAISELVRVARPGAPIFVSVMGRLGVLVVILYESQPEIGLPHFKQLRDTGDYFGGHGFTACHFFLPEELREVFDRDGIDVMEMVGLEGISSHHHKALKELVKDEKRWSDWLETHYQTCTHPAVVGMSEHMLVICRKKTL
jgi:SAM-dependent methyltransferase